jgi:glutathione S-transferase
MLTLYHAPRSRSSRFLWLLEELGAPYEVVKVEIRRTDGSGASDPRNPNPEKKVPTLVHDGVLVIESAAIALYLTDLFPDAGVGPRIGDRQRGPYLGWLAYYAGVLEPVLVAKVTGLGEKDPGHEAAYAAMARRLESALSPGPFLLGERFSAADVLVASAFQFAPHLMPQGPVFDAYVERIAARPALQRALAKDDA